MSATTFFSISLLLSIAFGNFIACSKLGDFDFIQIFFYLAIHIIMVILVEYKMDNMFRPLTAIRNWRRKTFDEQFKFVNNFPKFTEEQPMTMDYVQEIRCTIETLVTKSKKIDCNRSETEKLFNSRLNKIENLLAEADTVYLDSGLNFKVKNVKNISIDGVMEMYSIQLNSKRDLKNLMLHKTLQEK